MRGEYGIPTSPGSGIDWDAYTDSLGDGIATNVNNPLGFTAAQEGYRNFLTEEKNWVGELATAFYVTKVEGPLSTASSMLNITSDLIGTAVTTVVGSAVIAGAGLFGTVAAITGGLLVGAGMLVQDVFDIGGYPISIVGDALGYVIGGSGMVVMAAGGAGFEVSGTAASVIVNSWDNFAEDTGEELTDMQKQADVTMTTTAMISAGVPYDEAMAWHADTMTEQGLIDDIWPDFTTIATGATAITAYRNAGAAAVPAAKELARKEGTVVAGGPNVIMNLYEVLWEDDPERQADLMAEIDLSGNFPELEANSELISAQIEDPNQFFEVLGELEEDKGFERDRVSENVSRQEISDLINQETIGGEGSIPPGLLLVNERYPDGVIILDGLNHEHTMYQNFAASYGLTNDDVLKMIRAGEIQLVQPGASGIGWEYYNFADVPPETEEDLVVGTSADDAGSSYTVDDLSDTYLMGKDWDHSVAHIFSQVNFGRDPSQWSDIYAEHVGGDITIDDEQYAYGQSTHSFTVQGSLSDAHNVTMQAVYDTDKVFYTVDGTPVYQVIGYEPVDVVSPPPVVDTGDNDVQ